MKGTGKTMKKRKGVTLIELIVTMVIIGILLGIAVPNYVAYTDKAMAASKEQTAERIMATVKDAALYARSNGGEFDLDLINRNLADVKVAWDECPESTNRIFKATEKHNEATDTWGVSIYWDIDDFRTSIKIVAPDDDTPDDTPWKENWPDDLEDGCIP